MVIIENLRNIDLRKLLLITVALSAVIISVGTVIYSANINQTQHGGRGGAIGVALTFFMLFIGKNTPKNVLDADFKDIQIYEAPTDEQKHITKIELRSGQNRMALSAMLDWAIIEKRWLALASIVSTIFWGFGDCFADWIVLYCNGSC